jgi:hypothetical protein
MAIALPLPRPAILRTTLVQRLWFGAGGLAIFITTILVMRVAVTSSQPGAQTLGLDFMSFYTAGSALNEGRSADLYNLKATRQFQAMLGQRDGIAVEGRYAPWWNPPFYAIVFKPLAKFRFQTALALWTVINLLCAAIACWLLARVLPANAGPSRTLLIPTLMLISVPMFLTFTHGQNACTSLLLLTATVCLWRSRRGFAAGLAGGLLFYKPQLAAVIAIVMVIDLGWRALAGYAATGFALLVTTLIILPGALTAFLRTVPKNLAFVQNECPYPWDRHATFKAFWRILLQGQGIAPTSPIVKALGVLCIAIIAVAFGRLVLSYSLSQYSGGGLERGSREAFRRNAPHPNPPPKYWEREKRKTRDRLIAATIAVTPLLMPFYFDYDLLLLAVPAVLLAAEWIQSDEHSPSDRWLLRSFAALYLIMLFASDLAEQLRFNPIPPLLAMVAFLLIRRAGLPRSRSTSLRSQNNSNCRTPACS